MTYSNIEQPEATVYLISKSFVEHNGVEYRYWAELDTRDNELTYEFNGKNGEPGDSFYFEQFEKDQRAIFEDWHSFCDDNNVKGVDL